MLQKLGNLLAPLVEGRKPTYKGESSNPLREWWLDFIGRVLPGLFEVGGRPSTRINHDGSVLALLDTLKNLFLGKIKLPHTPMINLGIHSMTIEGVYSEKIAKK